MVKIDRLISDFYFHILDNEQEYISLTDMLKAKNGDFFISDWLRNRKTVEYLGIWNRFAIQI